MTTNVAVGVMVGVVCGAGVTYYVCHKEIKDLKAKNARKILTLQDRIKAIDEELRKEREKPIPEPEVIIKEVTKEVQVPQKPTKAQKKLEREKFDMAITLVSPDTLTAYAFIREEDIEAGDLVAECIQDCMKKTLNATSLKDIKKVSNNFEDRLSMISEPILANLPDDDEDDDEDEMDDLMYNNDIDIMDLMESEDEPDEPEPKVRVVHRDDDETPKYTRRKQRGGNRRKQKVVKKREFVPSSFSTPVEERFKYKIPDDTLDGILVELNDNERSDDNNGSTTETVGTPSSINKREVVYDRRGSESGDEGGSQSGKRIYERADDATYGNGTSGDRTASTEKVVMESTLSASEMMQKQARESDAEYINHTIGEAFPELVTPENPSMAIDYSGEEQITNEVYKEQLFYPLCNALRNNFPEMKFKMVYILNQIDAFEGEKKDTYESRAEDIINIIFNGTPGINVFELINDLYGDIRKVSKG